jgi:hypothetical protein
MHVIRTAVMLVLFAHLPLISAAAQHGDARGAVYIISADCPACERVVPQIRELSRVLRIQVFVYGNGDMDLTPFKVRKAGNATLRRYGIHIFPSLAIMKNGAVRQLFAGEQDIRDARVILNAFNKGAWSVSEVIERKPQNRFRVTGWLVSNGEYFHNPQYHLTDRRHSVLIRPWLPFEAARSPFIRTHPRLMSDVIGKPVFLEGTATTIDGVLELRWGRN